MRHIGNFELNGCDESLLEVPTAVGGVRQKEKTGAGAPRQLGKIYNLCSRLPDSANGQGDVDLIDGVVDVFGDARLIFDFGGAQHILEQSLGFAQLGVRQRLRLLVFGVAAESHAQQLGGGLNLMHGFHAVALVIVVAGGQNEVGVLQHSSLLAVTERHGLELVLNGNGAARCLGGGWCRGAEGHATGQNGD